MSTPYYIPEGNVPLPPADADVITTACDYCIVACGYKVYRWPVKGGKEGGMAANDNAFGEDFPVEVLGPWVAPTQHNVVMHKGSPHHVVIVPDKDAEVVNTEGDSSVRGGCIAQKCYNPESATRDRLLSPMVRIYGQLQPVTWDFALDIAAELAKYTIKKHGANAFGVKMFSYQYIENTYALTKLFLRSINTANFTFHDTPSDVSSTPGFRDAGFDNFGPAYEDWMNAETLLICGTDPYETKTIMFTQHIMKGIQNGQKTIFLVPRRTAGVAYAEENGGLWLDVNPGTDLLVLNAIARIIVENGWQDKEWIEKWVNDKWGSSSGFGQGTRNTPWQWRTTWGKFQTKGFDDWAKWLMAQDEFQLAAAAELSGIDPEKIKLAAEMMAKPKEDGTRVKTSVMIEKGFYWSNNTGNTQAVSALGIIVGAGGRPGQMIGRAGGHQRGGARGGGYPRNKSPMKLPGRRRRALDTDTWTVAGHTRMAYVVGTTWIQAMLGSQQLAKRFNELTRGNPHQIESLNKEKIIETLKARVDSGGMVVVNQDIYLVDPIGAKFADIIFPAATWGEEDFMRANGERRVRLYQKFYDAPGDAKPDWWIAGQMGQKMGFEGFDWKNANEVAEEAAKTTRGSRKDFNMVKIVAKRQGKTLHEFMRELGTTGIQAPVCMKDDGTLQGTVRLHDTERKLDPTGPAGANMFNKKLTAFNSQTGRCNLQKSPWSLFSDYWEWMKPAPVISTLEAIKSNLPDRPLSEPEEIILSDEETRLLATAKAFKSGKKKVSWETAAAPHQDVQRYCARLLASVVNADVTESLIAALDKEIDEETRTAALFSLAKHGEKTGALPVRSVDVSQELAKDDDTEIRALAVRCLGWIQADGINQQLQGWLKHSDAQVRVEAVRALDQRNHASDPLIDALDDPYEGVSIAAARALARLYGVDAVDALVLFSLTNDGTFRREIGQLLGRYAPDAGAARLLDVLADDDQKARWLVAIDALAELFQQDPEPEALKVA